MTSTQGTVATRIRVCLAERNKPQTWLAKQISWSDAKLSSRMVGRTKFNTDDIDEVATAFGLTLTEFLTGTRVAA